MEKFQESGSKRKQQEDASKGSKRRKQAEQTGPPTASSGPSNYHSEPIRHSSTTRLSGSRTMFSTTCVPGINTPLQFPSADETQTDAPPSMDTPPPTIEALNASNAEIQLANYALQMLSARRFREWALCALVEEDLLTLWCYDRTCAVHTTPLNWREDTVSFIMIVLALSFCRPEAFGLDGLFANDGKTIRGKDFKIVKEDDKTGGLNPVPDLGLPEQPVLRMGDLIHRQVTVFGRATRVSDVDIGIEENGKFVSKSEGLDLVCKVSSQVTSRHQEPEFILNAREIDPIHSPALFAYAILRRDTPASRLRERCTPPKNNGWEERILVILILRKYLPAHVLGGQEWLRVFIDGFICHRRIWVKKRILHRDLSMQNLMCLKLTDGTYIGILNDFDLSAFYGPDGEVPRASSLYRTGTAAFMARELLKEKLYFIKHVYVHELESWFCIVLHTVLGYERQEPVLNDPLKKWRGRDWNSIAAEKAQFADLQVCIPYRSHSKNGGLMRKLITLFIIADNLPTDLLMKHAELADTVTAEEAFRNMSELQHEHLTKVVTWESFAKILGIDPVIIRDLADVPTGVTGPSTNKSVEDMVTTIQVDDE